MRFWPFVQDLNQLRENYGDAWQTFISNAGTTQVFGGANDVFTAKYFSELSGSYGETTNSETDQVKGGGGSRTTGMTGRPGLFPYEITTLNAEPGTEIKEILLYSGKGFAYADRLRYFEDFPEFVAFQKRLNLPANGESELADDGATTTPETKGYWRPVDPSEVFQPGGHFRMGPNGGPQVWVA